MNIFDDILDSTPKSQVVQMKKNYVVIALDRSGSMAAMKSETIEFFNSQVIEARNARDMDNRICLFTFGNDVKEEMWDVDANEVILLDGDTYNPDGWTSMLDAVGMGINKLLQQSDINEEHVSVLFIIISDGMENHSKEYTYKSIATMIQEVNKTNRWTFVYLGASGQDLANVREMGIGKKNSMAYTASCRGLTAASMVNSRASNAFYDSRMKGATMSSSFYGGTDDNITGNKDNKRRKKNT